MPPLVNYMASASAINGPNELYQRILDGRAQLGRVTSVGGTALVSGDGLTADLDLSQGNPDPTWPLSVGTFGVMRQVRTRTAAAAGDDQAGIDVNGAGCATYNAPYLRVNGYVQTVANVRHFVGLVQTGQGFTACVTADAIAVEHVGFQFSTARPDTTWQFSRKGTGSHVLVDTGIAPGSVGSFILDIIDGQIVAALLSFAGLVLWSGTYTTDLPDSGGLDFAMGVETQTTASASFWFRDAFLAVRQCMSDAP